MTNDEVEEWGDVAEASSKKGMPTWLFFCGGGCLIAVILTAVGGFFAVQFVKDMVDPAVFWPKVDSLVTVDSPMPERFQPVMSISVAGTQQFQFLDKDTLLLVQVFSPPSSEEAGFESNLFQEDPSFPGMMLEHQDNGVMTIQGRELPFVEAKSDLIATKQRVLFLNATTDGGELVIMSFIHDDGSRAIPREDVSDLLQVFHIGPDR